MSSKLACLVVGADSFVGCEVVRQLTARGIQTLVASARDKSQAIAEQLNNVRTVFLSSPSYFEINAIDPDLVPTLARSGARRVVFLSTFEAGIGGGSRSGKFYQQLEASITRSGLNFTILRAAPLMQELTTIDPPYPVRKKGLDIPYGNARCAFVDARDVAAVAVKAMTEAGHESRVYTLTGPEALTLTEAMDSIGKVTQANIRYQNAEISFFRQSMRAWN